MITVLVVEDDRKLREVLRSFLERAGLAVLTTDSGAEAMELAAGDGVDLVVLDLGLPDVPGQDVLREIRRTRQVPVLILTGHGEPEDRIAGLELGADDFVSKPFSPREVVLRVQAITRRTVGADGADTVRTFGGGLLRIDESRRTTTVDGAEVALTPSEWRLLLALAAVPGRVYSRLELINRVRGHEFDGYERSIDSHVKNLRRKIEPDGEPRIVRTVLGGGYRLGLDEDG